MPNTMIGVNPSLLTLMKHGASVSFGDNTLLPESDGIGDYIRAVKHTGSSRTFSVTAEGVLGAMLYLGIQNYESSDRFSIEDNPPLARILDFGGIVFNNGNSLSLRDRKLYVNNMLVGNKNNLNLGMSLRAIGLEKSSVRGDVVSDVEINIVGREVIIRLKGVATTNDIVGIAANVYAAIVDAN